MSVSRASRILLATRTQASVRHMVWEGSVGEDMLGGKLRNRVGLLLEVGTAPSNLLSPGGAMPFLPQHGGLLPLLYWMARATMVMPSSRASVTATVQSTSSSWEREARRLSSGPVPFRNPTWAGGRG